MSTWNEYFQYAMMPQAEWYIEPHVSVSPLGGRNVAEMKYNNRSAIIIAKNGGRSKAEIFPICFTNPGDL
jgi:hypothetical protein